MLGLPKVADIRYYDRGNDPQPLDDFACVVESTHMGVAGGQNAMRVRLARILLDREEQRRHCFIEAPTDEMREAYYNKRRADAGARTEAQRCFEVLNADVGLACPNSEGTADEPPTA